MSMYAYVLFIYVSLVNACKPSTYTLIPERKLIEVCGIPCVRICLPDMENMQEEMTTGSLWLQTTGNL